MDTKRLWNNRTASFWGEILPHLRYVLSSGLAAFMVILFIVSTHYYAHFINHFPNDFPANWVIAIILLPIITLSPIRTFFKPADIIYLLPAETKMKSYLQRSFNFSFALQSVLAAVVWFIAWPMYRESTDANGLVFLLVLFILLVMKWINLYGRWHEMQFQENAHRRYFAFLRWVLNAVSLYVLFTFVFWKAGIFIALALLTYALSLRLPSKHVIHWEYLIELEKQQRARYYQFLSWFVDMPEHQNQVHPRLLFSKVTKFLSFQQQSTYRYLYLKTWIRSDLFGIAIRLIVVGIIMIYLLPQDLLKAILFIFFVYLIGVQLSALAYYHRYVFWIHVYPLTEDTRVKSVLQVIFGVHIMALHLLYFPFLLTFSSMKYAIGTYIFGIIILYIHYLKLQKNLRRKSDD